MRHGQLSIIVPAGIAAGLAIALPGAVRSDDDRAVTVVGFVGVVVGLAAVLFPAGRGARFVAGLGGICAGLALGAAELVDDSLVGADLARAAIGWMLVGWVVWITTGVRERRRDVPTVVAIVLGAATVAGLAVVLALATWHAPPPPPPASTQWPSLQDWLGALCSEGRCK